MRPSTRSTVTSLGRPLRGDNNRFSSYFPKRRSDSAHPLTSDAANSSLIKRHSDPVVDSNRPLKGHALQERSLSSLNISTNRSDDSGRDFGPSQRHLIVQGKETLQNVLGEEGLDLESKVSVILEKKMREMSEAGRLL